MTEDEAEMLASEMDSLVVWKVMGGPFSVDDLPEDEQPGHPAFQSWLVLMVAPEDCPEDWFDYELWFESFDHAYQYKMHVDKSMEPKPLRGVMN